MKDGATNSYRGAVSIDAVGVTERGPSSDGGA